MTIAITVFFSLLIGFSSARLIAKYGLRLGLADVPSERSSHNQAVPRGGGIGIPLAVAFTTIVFAKSGYGAFLLALFLSLISFCDDIREISIGIRLIAHCVASVTLLLIVGPVALLNTLSALGSAIQPLGFFFLALYIVSSTNFFNFMDGIDGIAGFEALISFSLLGFYALYFRNRPDLAVISFSIVAASLGFLLLNFPRARVFMGDVGSIFLGFFFSFLVIMLATDLKEFLMLNLLQAVFFVDCSSTILLRLLKKENIFLPHKKHLFQKMVHNLGWSHKRVTLLLSFLQLLTGLLALALLNSSILFFIIVWLGLYLIYWSAVSAMRQI